MVYMVDLHTNSEMVVRSQQPKFAFPCVYSVQVSAVNSAGEGERSSSTTINSEWGLLLTAWDQFQYVWS